MPHAHRCLLLATSLALLPAACGNSVSQRPGPDAGPGDPNLVKISTGLVHGSATATMRSWLGIPYAAPPVGKLRWKAPTAAEKLTATLEANKLGPHCVQSMTPFGTESTSEDCLYLNIYAPTAPGLHPVMVWIHGGSLVVGESDEYDPTPLVAEGVVVVTINYRLGMLGFMAHPALTAENKKDQEAANKDLPDEDKKPVVPHSGNYGLLDQQFALQWVQDNIVHFSGDNSKVTVFGESAGGLSVHAQLVMKGAADLFAGAIVQSGAYAVAAPLPTLAQAELEGVDMATRAGCPAGADCTVDKLRELKVEDILVAQATSGGKPKANWFPIADGVLIPEGGIGAAYAAGKYAKSIPVIEGSNHDEYRLFAAIDELNRRHPLTADEYKEAAKTTFGLSEDDAVRLIAGDYAPSKYGDNVSLAFAALGTDRIFACNSRTTARTFLASDTDKVTSKVYVYEFNDPAAPMLFLPPVSFPYGAAHASELQYLFHLPNSVLSAESQAVADKMVKYWTNFAKTGDPNGDDLPKWAVYATNTGDFADLVMKLAPGANAMKTTQDFAADHHCP